MNIQDGQGRRHMSRRDFLAYSLAGGALTLVGSALPGVISVGGASSGALRPFPQHVTYTAGTIKPNHISQEQLDEATRDFYDAWKSEYLSSGCGSGRRYVDIKDGDTISISEGHGYGMMISALMAGHDSQAKSDFDGMYAFFEDHQSKLTQHLMAWKQNESCEDIDGRDSATDGDMDIAYALLLADRQWGSSGGIDYLGQATDTIDAIMAEEINPQTFHPELGDWVEPSGKKYFFSTRSSDFMTNHWRAYEAATGDARWTKVVDSTYKLTRQLQKKFSRTTGLLPDFIQNTGKKPRPADPGFLEGSTDGQYSYNACRVPWRIGTDYLLSGDPRARATMSNINAWIRKKTGNDPRKIRNGYKLNGDDVRGRAGNESAFVAPLGVGAMVRAEDQDWLNSVWDVVDGRRVEDEDYYSNTLKLLAMITMSGNWWAP